MEIDGATSLDNLIPITIFSLKNIIPFGVWFVFYVSCTFKKLYTSIIIKLNK